MRRNADQLPFCCDRSVGCSEFCTFPICLPQGLADPTIQPETLLQIVDGVPREIGPAIVAWRSEKPQLHLADCSNVQWLGDHWRSVSFHLDFPRLATSLRLNSKASVTA